MRARGGIDFRPAVASEKIRLVLQSEKADIAVDLFHSVHFPSELPFASRLEDSASPAGSKFTRCYVLSIGAD